MVDVERLWIEKQRYAIIYRFVVALPIDSEPSNTLYHHFKKR